MKVTFASQIILVTENLVEMFSGNEALYLVWVRLRAGCRPTCLGWVGREGVWRGWSRPVRSQPRRERQPAAAQP